MLHERRVLQLWTGTLRPLAAPCCPCLRDSGYTVLGTACFARCCCSSVTVAPRASAEAWKLITRSRSLQLAAQDTWSVSGQRWPTIRRNGVRETGHSAVSHLHSRAAHMLHNDSSREAGVNSVPALLCWPRRGTPLSSKLQPGALIFLYPDTSFTQHVRAADNVSTCCLTAQAHLKAVSPPAV